MDKTSRRGQIMIECPSTIFCLYVTSENELSKIEIFMQNIRYVKKLRLNDIYRWCNRQGISYKTQFNYNRHLSIWKNIRSYILYSRQKMKYQLGMNTV